MSSYKPDPNKNINLTVNGIPVTVSEGSRILEAAKKAGVQIPTLCDHPDLCKRSLCRLCVVECDGRGKLIAACANDVYEGVKVVTNNLRIMTIRKTILELLLANHPQECLTCVKNKKCELQKLAETFGIRESPFRREALDNRPPKTESETLVRDMNKCIKCGRCVAVCQEIQTVRAINSSCRNTQYEICTPYGQSLSDSHCIFCGQCAAVCPVGAIFENDQTGEVWSALESPGRHVVAEISSSVAAGICGELDLPPGSVTGRKMVTALKRMGFNKVFDAGVMVHETVREEIHELIERKNNHGKLPLVTSCSPAWINFVKEFYPDLSVHLPAAKDPIQNFGALAKSWYEKESGTDKSKITSVSITPCIVKKFEARRMHTNGFRDVDVALTTQEIARMIKLAGIDLCDLPETPFDTVKFDIVKSDVVKPDSKDKSQDGIMEAILRTVYKDYTGETPIVPEYNDVQNRAWLREAELDFQGSKVKVLIVNGFANARIVMEAIRKGECDAAFVEIISCPSGCATDIAYTINRAPNT